MHSKIYDNSVNYTATVVEIKQLFPIENSNNILRAVINHCDTVVSKDTGIGEWGLFFPPETQLSDVFLKNNNLYRDNTLNVDTTQKGYFEVNGRIRCQVFRGVKSEGFYIPIKSLDFLGIDLTDISVGYEFNEIEGIEICKKYIPKNSRTPGAPGSKSQAKKKQIEMIVEGQFRLMRDTEQLKKHIDEVKPDDIISITYKLHGTSAVFSNILVKRVLSRFERFLKWCGVNIQDTKYGNVYSSRTVIKDVDGIKHSEGGFYGTDIWGIVNDEIKDKILQGYTLYGEIVGYLPDGKMIQKNYDYGCEPNQHEFYVYRITHTNPEGHVHELGWQDLKDYCNKFGLNHVPELYFGKARDFNKSIPLDTSNLTSGLSWNDCLLESLQNRFLEKDCYMCKTKAPAEGIVLRIEKGNKSAFKLKSFAFLKKESEQLDTGEIDIESQESQTE